MNPPINERKSRIAVVTHATIKDVISLKKERSNSFIQRRCDVCGNCSLMPAGTCSVCSVCGNSTGCS